MGRHAAIFSYARKLLRQRTIISLAGTFWRVEGNEVAFLLNYLWLRGYSKKVNNDNWNS